MPPRILTAAVAARLEDGQAQRRDPLERPEARRCLSCGNCFECDNCYGMCPDNAIVKLGPGNRFRIDYDYCKGCGICAAECPCGAIDMLREEDEGELKVPA